MQRPSTAPGRRPPVMVVQTDDDPSTLARRLAAAPLIASIDLRNTKEPILPEVVEEAARARATANLPERRAAYRRRETELAAEVTAASAAHHEAAAFADRSAERRKDLLDGAFWCEGKRALMLELDTELAGAQGTVDAAAHELAGAIAAADALEAKTAAVAEEIEASHRQLLELEMAGRPEAELRRDLATARRSAEEVSAAAANAERRVADLRNEVVVGEARATAIAKELRSLEAALAADPAPVAAALERLETAPLVDADPASLRLATEFERLTAELATLPPAPPGPDDATIAAAEQTAAAANEALEVLRRPIAPAEPPPWWDELSRLHAAVVDAETAAGGGGFGRKAAHRRLEETMAAERAFLADIGYASHLDALMSGGRPTGVPRPGLLSLADAERAVVRAEQRLLELRAAADAAAAPKRVRSDLARIRALGGAMLGVAAGDLTPELLRRQRVDPAATEALWSALAAADVADRTGGATVTAMTWLAARSSAGSRLVVLTAEARTVELTLADRTRQRPGAESDVTELATAATAARRQVAAFESELAHRAEHPLDPAARAAAATEIRERIDDLESSHAAAVALATEAVEAARQRHARALARHHEAEQEVADYRAHAAALAALLDEPVTGRLDDLGPLAAALRTTVTQLDLQVVESGRSVALTSAALAASRAAQAAHQSASATDPLAEDRAAVLAELLQRDARVTDVVVEPALGLDPSGYELVLDELAAAGADKQVVVVTGDRRFVSWAIEQPGRLVEVIPAATVDPGLSPADRIDKAQAQ